MKPKNAPRFIKISATGKQLSRRAKKWVAVLDTRTGLMWSVDESPRMSEPDCVAYATKLSVAGFSDWQLPALDQLETLRDVTKYAPAIDTDFFPGCKSDWYWTSTPSARSPSVYAWYVSFGYGYSYRFYRYYGGFVRAVRVGQSLAVGVSS